MNGPKLEAALRDAGFEPDTQMAWRWRDNGTPGMVIKIEFRADLDDAPNESTISFDGCMALGAVNLRGTGFAARDWDMRSVSADPNRKGGRLPSASQVWPGTCLPRLTRPTVDG